MGILAIFSNLKEAAIFILLLTCGSLYLLWSKEKSDNAVLRSNQITLQSTVSNQNKTIEGLVETSKKINDNMSKFIINNEALNTSLSQKIIEINNLRARENELAIQNPYERGNVAANMFHDRLSSIVTSESDRNSNKDNN